MNDLEIFIRVPSSRYEVNKTRMNLSQKQPNQVWQRVCSRLCSSYRFQPVSSPPMVVAEVD